MKKDKHTGLSDEVSCPPPLPAPTDPRAKAMKRFHALDQDGIARVGEKLSDGDIYVNKYRPTAQVNPETQMVNPATVSYRPEE